MAPPALRPSRLLIGGPSAAPQVVEAVARSYRRLFAAATTTADGITTTTTTDAVDGTGAGGAGR
jgi:hypothetical protein